MNAPVRQLNDVVVSTMTAEEALVMACKSNPAVLAKLFSTNDDDTFTVVLNLHVPLKASECKAILQDKHGLQATVQTVPPPATGG